MYEYEAGKWAYCINQDKVQNRREKSGKGRQIMKFEDEIKDVTNGKLLNSIINKSLDVMPRNHVLIGIKTKLPMIVTSYDSALGELFKPRKPRQNLIRKAYVNFWYRKDLSFGVLKEIADRMRHSIGVGLSSYKKIGIPAPSLIGDDEEKKEPPTVIAKPDVVIPILPVEVPRVIPVLPKPVEVKAPMAEPKKLFDYVQYNREYRVKNAAILNKKQSEKYYANKEQALAAKIVRKLNAQQTTKPIPASILKYGLKQDDFTGRWKSSILDDEGKHD